MKNQEVVLKERAAIAKGTHYVKKHNAAIHCSADLTLLQRKLANCLLFNAYKDLLSKDFYEITITELMALLEVRTNDHQKLKDSIKILMSTVIEWNVLHNVQNKNLIGNKKEKGSEKGNLEENRWKASTLLSSVQIVGSLVKYEYSRTLKELFYKPSHYSQIKLTIQNKFKSVYALVLYENCLRYLNVGSTGWIPIILFRKIMGVVDGQYCDFSDLNRRVIKAGINEINKLSDISISCEIKKINRKPTQIKFLVNKKESFDYPSEGKKENDYESLAKKLMMFGIPTKTINVWLEKYESSYILEKIELIDSSSNEIRNIGGFLSVALKNDYRQGNLKPKIQPIIIEEGEEKLWEKKLSDIKSNINHWKFMLNIAENEKNYIEMKKIQTYLANYENELKIHYLEKQQDNQMR